MVDVDEVYSSLWKNPDNLKRKRGAKSKEETTTQLAVTQSTDPEVELLIKRVESMKVTNSSNIKHRHVNQLFIRGDNIVSINAAVA